MRGMPSVATDSTCVSPRWNRPVPCAVSSTPTSADSGRMSAGPRPSMRTPSLTMRLADDFLLQRAERPLHLAGLLGERAGRVDGADERDRSSASDLVELGVAVGLVGDRHRRGGRRPRRAPSPPSYTVGRVVDRSAGTRSASIGPRAFSNSSRSCFCRSIDALIHCFDSSRPSAIDLFGDLRRALFVELPRALGAAGLDHHDRDVAVVELTAGDDDLERRLVALLERRVRDPLAVVVREAHRADRTVERDARDGERGRRAVDRRDVVRVLEVDTEDGRDDLHLVAEVGRERRPQRTVGEAARSGSPARRDGLHDGRTSRGSCPRRTCALRRRR